MKFCHQAIVSGVLFLMLSACGSVFAQRIRGDVTESEFDKRVKAERESAFSPWMPAKEAFEVFRRSKLDGRLLLAAERNSNSEIRLLLFFPPDGKGADITYENDVPEETLLERHALWQKQEYNILYARKNPSGNYTAIWIVSARFGVAVKRLNELGISTAIVRIKSSESTDAPQSKAPVTAPLRQWRDKTGRLLQASVAGIDGGTVNFVRTDGKKFPFPLADLSDADQKYLAELQSKAAPASDTSTSAAATEGFTDWMSRSDFETAVTAERVKDRFVIFLESNSRNEFRGIFTQRPQPARWFMAWAEPEQSLREKHASYVAQGFALMSLSLERRTDRYCAVWASNLAPGDVKAQQGKFGITSPSIDEKITVSTVPKR